MRAWLTAKHDEHFDDKVRHICALYQQAPGLLAENAVVYSTDEMNGVQALERLHPDKPMRPGEPVKKEFEYIPHGTLSLIVHREVATGQVIAPFAAPTLEAENCVLAVVLAISERPEVKKAGGIGSGLCAGQPHGQCRRVLPQGCPERFGGGGGGRGQQPLGEDRLRLQSFWNRQHRRRQPGEHLAAEQIDRSVGVPGWLGFVPVIGSALQAIGDFQAFRCTASTR
ncbi:hypothetical protein [Gloeobacter violaceus]|uniref:hypothetical protein n=1 Tax=Gloeobacter violaceus TaxID=33072 RepID=UPI0013E8E720|nr:hypothetical protein [Gloeobacter violaceus]